MPHSTFRIDICRKIKHDYHDYQTYFGCACGRSQAPRVHHCQKLHQSNTPSANQTINQSNQRHGTQNLKSGRKSNSEPCDHPVAIHSDTRTHMHAHEVDRRTWCASGLPVVVSVVNMLKASLMLRVYKFAPSLWAYRPRRRALATYSMAAVSPASHAYRTPSTTTNGTTLMYSCSNNKERAEDARIATEYVCRTENSAEWENAQ